MMKMPAMDKTKNFYTVLLLCLQTSLICLTGKILLRKILRAAAHRCYKKKHRTTVAVRCLIKLFFGKAFLSKSANGANPILGNILKLGSRGDSLVGSALGLIINIAAGANIFSHDVFSFRIIGIRLFLPTVPFNIQITRSQQRFSDCTLPRPRA